MWKVVSVALLLLFAFGSHDAAQAGALVNVASTSRTEATSHNGVKVKPQVAIADVRPEQCDAIVLVGGLGAMTWLMDDQALSKLLTATLAQGKVIAAICVAPAVLARSGLLAGRSATCYKDKAVIEALKKRGAAYVDKDVVTDGRIVTGNGPEASKAFASRVLEVLGTR